MLKRGEEIRVLVKYDLFDLDLEGKIGMYVTTSAITKKHLCYFWDNGEWAELSPEHIEAVNPGHIPPKNIEFSSRIKTLEYSYPI